MDEPTSSLTPHEFERLAVLIERLAAQGRLDHLRLAQDGRGVPGLPATATILRDGERVGELDLGRGRTEDVVVA